MKLVECMRRRLLHNQDSVDLLLCGVEASLWLAEQFASDLRRIFPFLNVTTISANKYVRNEKLSHNDIIQSMLSERNFIY